MTFFIASVIAMSSVTIAAPWPNGTEHTIDISGASNDLSGATWNPVSQSLWAVRQNRQIWEFAYNPGSDAFELEQTLVLPSGVGTDIEACAQVDHSATDELYSLDEDNGRVSRVVDIPGTPTVLRTWNLLVLNNGNSLPPESGGFGPEGLEFVPDEHLFSTGFRYPDGSVFAGSTKGMGGLMLIGHQIEGRLHVFDVNPDLSEDFINHGSFLTSATEIAGLHFDRTSGLMYVWDNPGGGNLLEISDLSSDVLVGRIDTKELYDTAMPSGNIEGIAVVGSDSCGEFGSQESNRVFFLTRDGDEPNLSYFDAFPCSFSGACCVSSGCDVVTETSCENFGGTWLGDSTACEDCSSVCAGDTNNDGVVDVIDLLKVIDQWGTCL